MHNAKIHPPGKRAGGFLPEAGGTFNSESAAGSARRRQQSRYTQERDEDSLMSEAVRQTTSGNRLKQMRAKVVARIQKDPYGGDKVRAGRVCYPAGAKDGDFS